MKPSSSSDKVAATGDWGVKSGAKVPGSPLSLSLEESYKTEVMPVNNSADRLDGSLVLVRKTEYICFK